MTAFPTLLSPLRAGRAVLPNRVIMGSMHTRLEDLDDPVRRQIAFYAERARGGVAMIVTGGFSPDEAGRLDAHGPMLCTREQARALRPIVAAVHDAGARMLLQILHAGRYAAHDRLVGASAIPSPINRRVPRRLAGAEVVRTVEAFVRCAELAAEAGYDGVEVMGSEGYLINQFVAARTNDRDDDWGGPFERRIRFPVEIVRRIRERLGPAFLVMYRISALDLVEGGSTAEEIDALARAVEAAGADLLNTGIGWHEARVPTIAYPVPRAVWRFATARLKRVVGIPVVASNRINTPEVAEGILARDEADLVSLARPLLADPEFVAKAAAGHADEIVPCIACNQACLDYIFRGKAATCLVNPRAGRELDLPVTPASPPRRVAVVGAGAAGLACATTASARGHRVTLFEAQAQVGGQLNLARRVPVKDEFEGLLRSWRARLDRLGTDVRLSTRVTSRELREGGFDRVIVATGVVPRRPALQGVDHPKVASYADVLSGRVVPGHRVAIIGAGGIGYDVAEFLTGPRRGARAEEAFLAEWGVDAAIASGGGLRPASEPVAPREVWMLQRKPTRPGAHLGATTGWILRSTLQRRGVKMLSGCEYRRVDDEGLHVVVDGREQCLPVDTVVLCAGQEPERALAAELDRAGIPVDVIGGAERAEELDALRAIDQGVRLALAL